MSINTKALFDAKAAKKVFELFDTNEDGKIDAEEIAVVLRRLDATRWTDDRIKCLVRAFDDNDNGIIDSDEFLAWIFSAEGGSAAFTLLAENTKIEEKKCRLAGCKRGCKCPTQKCGGCNKFVKIAKHVDSSTRDHLTSTDGVRKASDLVRCRNCLAKESAERMDTKQDEDYAAQKERDRLFADRRRARAERMGPLAVEKLERQIRIESDPKFAARVKDLRKRPMQALKTLCKNCGYSLDDMRAAMAEDEPSWALVELIMEKEEEIAEEEANKKAKAASAAAETGEEK